MADDGGSLVLDGRDLTEEHQHILQLQSEAARKQEWYERLEQKRVALDEELRDRERERDEVKSRYTVLREGASRNVHQNERKDAAVRNFMGSEVMRVLQRRIPIMDSAQEDLDSSDDQGPDAQAQKEEHDDTTKHDTVAVCYLSFVEEKGHDEYWASFRFARDTTVEQLRNDACNYWGCSTNDYILLRRTAVANKADPADKRESGKNSKFDKLQEESAHKLEDVLSSGDEAYLWLLRHEDTDKIERAFVPKAAKPTKEPEAAEEAEAFVDAFKLWPGLYNTLRQRNLKPHAHWVRVRMADLVVVLFMVGVSVASFGFRSWSEFYLLRTGALHILSVNRLRETPRERDFEGFEAIQWYEDIPLWMNRTFIPQLCDPDSILREFYTPTGFLRLRQQKAMRKPCSRGGVVEYIRRPCFHVDVSEGTEQTSELTGDAARLWGPLLALNGTGRQPTPNPLRWGPSLHRRQTLPGKINSEYDASGYMVDYSLASSDINATCETLARDLAPIFMGWLDNQTRMFVVEFALANYNLDGYVAASFLLEMAPSGAILPSALVWPFHFGEHGHEAVALGFDIVRFLIVVVYFMFVRVYNETRSKVEDHGRSGLHYVFSFNGLIDQCCTAVFVALQVMRYKPKPPEPSRLARFHSYHEHAATQEFIGIAESLFFFFLMVRLAMFMRMMPEIFRFVKVFSKSSRMFAHFGLMFLPLIFGANFLASCLFRMYIPRFSTVTSTFMSLLLMFQGSIDLTALNEKSRWTLPFFFYFLFEFLAILMHMFLAIIAYAAFEIELVEESRESDKWSKDQWFDWLLWGPVYRRVFQKHPGSSRKDYTLGDDEDSDEEEEEEDDAEEK